MRFSVTDGDNGFFKIHITNLNGRQMLQISEICSMELYNDETLSLSTAGNINSVKISFQNKRHFGFLKRLQEIANSR